MDQALVLSRALHFAATISTSGIVLFRLLVARPGASSAALTTGQRGASGSDRQLRLIFWISLMLALVSGAAWFLLVAADIVDRPLGQVFADDAAWTVLTGTQFGQAWLARLFVGTMLALSIEKYWPCPIAAALAAGFVGGLAWAGHAGGTPGLVGDLHLVSDILHLTGAAAWLGGLLPLVCILKAGRSPSTPSSDDMVGDVTRRFSILGVVAVGTILATGTFNTWNMVGSYDALLITFYGRLVLLKVALFAAMVSIAAVNRFRLTPRLAAAGMKEKLERNCLIEIALGLIILVVVAILGMLDPALHSHAGHMS